MRRPYFSICNSCGSPKNSSKHKGCAKVPKPLSIGEETLASHLGQHNIKFDREVCLIPGRKWRFDFVVPAARLAIEVHGAIWQNGKHARGDGLERDYAKLNAAVRAGYLPLQYSTRMVTDGTAIDEVLEVLGALNTSTI